MLLSRGPWTCSAGVVGDSGMSVCWLLRAPMFKYVEIFLSQVFTYGWCFCWKVEMSWTLELSCAGMEELWQAQAWLDSDTLGRWKSDGIFFYVFLGKKCVMTSGNPIHGSSIKNLSSIIQLKQKNNN